MNHPLPDWLDALTPELIEAEGAADFQSLKEGQRVYCWLCGDGTGVFSVWRFTHRCSKCHAYYFRFPDRPIQDLTQNPRFRCPRCKKGMMRLFKEEVVCFHCKGAVRFDSPALKVIWLAESLIKRLEMRQKGILSPNGGPTFSFWAAKPWTPRVELSKARMKERLRYYNRRDIKRKAAGLDVLMDNRHTRKIRRKYAL